MAQTTVWITIRPGVLTLKTTRRPYKKALSLADIQIGEKYVVFTLTRGVVQFDPNNDVIMDAKTVTSTDYTEGTLTYHEFDLQEVTAKLADFGVPNLEAGDGWNREICMVTLDDAIADVRAHINKLRDRPQITPTNEHIMTSRLPLSWAT